MRNIILLSLMLLLGLAYGLSLAPGLTWANNGADGGDLITRGLQPGPQFSHILQELRRATLDGEIKSPQDEAAYLDQLLLEEAH